MNFSRFDPYAALANSEVAPAKPAKAAKVETSPSTRSSPTPHVGAVELVFVEACKKVTPQRPESPPCPLCASVRYWIAASGKVVCGVCGVTRFILASISYHSVS